MYTSNLVHMTFIFHRSFWPKRTLTFKVIKGHFKGHLSVMPQFHFNNKLRLTLQTCNTLSSHAFSRSFWFSDPLFYNNSALTNNFDFWVLVLLYIYISDTGVVDWERLLLLHHTILSDDLYPRHAGLFNIFYQHRWLQW